MRYLGGGNGMVGMREVKETVRKVDWVGGEMQGQGL